MGAEDVFGGIAGGLKGLTDFLMLQRRMQLEDEERKRLDAAEGRRVQQHELSMQQGDLERQLAQRTLGRVPQLEAMEDVKNRMTIQGMEGSLNDPAIIPLLERAGIPMERKQPALPEFFTGAQGLSGQEITPQQLAAGNNREMGVFPQTGIVKPPEVRQKEAARELAIRQAETTQQVLSRLGTSGQLGNIESPEARLAMRFGLDINPNEVFGPIRQTPEEAAAIAEAQAKARYPYQKDLINYGVTQRAGMAGDPYFNTAFQAMAPILPFLDEATIMKFIDAANMAAKGAQGVVPRGAPGAGGPAAAPPPKAAGDGSPDIRTVEQIVNDGISTFGGADGFIAALSRPEVQQKLTADGIDPATVLRLARIRKHAGGR